MFNATKVNVKSSATSQNAKWHRPSLSFGTQESKVIVVVRVRPLVSPKFAPNLKTRLLLLFMKLIVEYILEREIQKFSNNQTIYFRFKQLEIFESGPKSIVEKSVIFQSIQYIYEHISADKDKKKYELSLTFLEIYNEGLKDLLQLDNVAPKQLKIRQSSQFTQWTIYKH
ncbi:hypothetical protein RFI_20310 [Reticulomyxa filosa]|uniref:Kinesin motor domain-containing protein n=1 Tax=Reticulomyxa filosa TaxID=46433 RepID=X6MUA5_RETFI|nr:hypothetical protein RFI_20310 [Reticulomyxa filosa]|eukprot:ETO17027.1 hypothetical protein RFI_20310 [Reticulomyxa filosa]